MKKILILHTGGTIGSVSDGGKLRVSKNAGFAGLLSKVLKPSDAYKYDVIELDPLLPSPNATPGSWSEMAKIIADNHSEYDAFIVTHGTDTMHYTASALSFMLENLDKPVVVTGSQVPLSVDGNDASDNLNHSICAVLSPQYPRGVSICFGGELLQANRAVKVDAQGRKAFATPNISPLATFPNSKMHIDADSPLLNTDSKLYIKPSEDFRYREWDPKKPKSVIVLKLYPGINAEFVSHVLTPPPDSVYPPPDGVILESYGAGHVPNDPRIIQAIKTATDSGTVIVAVTQCLRGHVETATYHDSDLLAKAGILNGGDMTTAGAFTKLHFLLGNDKGLERDFVKKSMQEDLKDEISPGASRTFAESAGKSSFGKSGVSR